MMAQWRALENRLHPFPDTFGQSAANQDDFLGFLGLPVDWSTQITFDTGFRALQEHLAKKTIMDPLPFPTYFNLNPASAKLLYAIVRFTRPSIVVETGVGNGLSTVHILSALEANERGNLFSVSYPPVHVGLRANVGSLVPPHLRTRWHLVLDDSIRGLHQVLRSVSAIDIFVHDSEHTYLQMRKEFVTVYDHLSNRAVVMADDATINSAFIDFAKAVQRTRRGRSGLIGNLGILASFPREKGSESQNCVAQDGQIEQALQ
jgi:predicted O-methyltransferase YrrM